jgi:hypothetical protein
VKIHQRLTSRVVAVVAVVALTGASAFAESRHSNGTRGRGESRDSSHQSSSSNRWQSRGGDSSSRPSRSFDRNRDNSRSAPSRSFDRNRDNSRSAPSRSFDRNRDNSRSAPSRSFDRNRDNSQSRGWNNTNQSRSFDRSGDSRGGNNWRGDRSARSNRGNFDGHRQPFFARGRVERIRPFNGGFRIWIGGAPFPFFVPSAFYYRNHFRLGLTIGLGGYYNPLGYYDYYDGYDSGYYGYDRGYIDSRGYSNGTLRGTVESVDYRRNTFVIRNESTGSFVTIEMRQRLTDVRAGDYVELTGDWTRSGVFEAYTADLLSDQSRRDDGYRRDDQYPR